MKETHQGAKRQEMGAVSTGQVTVSIAPSESSSKTMKQGNDLIQFLWFCFGFFLQLDFFLKKNVIFIGCSCFLVASLGSFTYRILSTKKYKLTFHFFMCNCLSQCQKALCMLLGETNHHQSHLTGNPVSYNIDWPGKVTPLVQQEHEDHGVTNHFLTGFKVLSPR